MFECSRLNVLSRDYVSQALYDMKSVAFVEFSPTVMEVCSCGGLR